MRLLIEEARDSEFVIAQAEFSAKLKEITGTDLHTAVKTWPRTKIHTEISWSQDNYCLVFDENTERYYLYQLTGQGMPDDTYVTRVKQFAHEHSIDDLDIAQQVMEAELSHY